MTSWSQCHLISDVIVLSFLSTLSHLGRHVIMDDMSSKNVVRWHFWMTWPVARRHVMSSRRDRISDEIDDMSCDFSQKRQHFEEKWPISWCGLADFSHFWTTFLYIVLSWPKCCCKCHVVSTLSATCRQKCCVVSTLSVTCSRKCRVVSALSMTCRRGCRVVSTSSTTLNVVSPGTAKIDVAHPCLASVSHDQDFKLNLFFSQLKSA